MKHILISRLLSHEKTKADLTNYLAAVTLEYNRTSHKLVISSSSGHTRSNKDSLFQDNNHEEADTLLTYQAVLASQQNPSKGQIVFFSQDTDVLVFILANYDEEHVHFHDIWSYGDRTNRESYRGKKSKGFGSLPCIHWADNTERFSG